MGRVNIEDYVLSDTGVYNVQSFISALRYAVGTVA